MTDDERSGSAVCWDDVSVTAGGQRILRGVTLDVRGGTWLSLVGPNGAGKTTLIRTLAGRTRHRGEVRINGEESGRLRARARARALAVVPQHPTVPAGMLVFDYVLLGRVPHQGIRCAPSDHDRSHCVAVLQRLELESFARRRFDSLSGGERQRVVLARAVAQDAPILVLDEPTAALDIGHQLEVLELIADLRSERTLTVITTVHDLTVAGQFADTVAILADGQVVAEGNPSEILTPALIGEHWGVDAVCDVDANGGVTVTVRRRREADTPAALHDPMLTDPLLNRRDPR